MHGYTKLTAGQCDALGELRLIEAQNGGLIIEGWYVDNGWLVVDVILDCSTIRLLHRPGGLVLRTREAAQIWVPEAFPLRPPSLYVTHTRFAGYENVMGGGGVCLFRSPDTEWDPADGMVVFIQERVWGWFLRAVKNEVERQGGDFHAPLLREHEHYRDVVRYVVDEPATEAIWSGFTRIRNGGRADYAQSILSAERWDLVAWTNSLGSRRRDERFGAALLLPERVGFYFPKTLGDLLRVVDRAGMPPRELVALLGAAAREGVAGEPVLFTVGVPLQATANGKRQHHLTTLVLADEAARLLWDAGGSRKKDEAIDATLRQADALSAGVVYGREARPGVTERRDIKTPMSWFEGKTVSIWGVGALGGPLSIQIARAGAAKLILRDSGFVSRGLLVRQPYRTADEEVLKVDALRHRLKEIRPNLVVAVDYGDLRKDTKEFAEWNGGADLIINASASIAVRAALDAARSDPQVHPVPILTVGVDSKAERGFARLLMPEASTSLAELERSTQIAVAQVPALSPYADAFFPAPDSPRRDPFYPEPGCSDSTFAGSAADMAALSGGMLNWAAKSLTKGETASAISLLMSQPHVALAEDCPAAHEVMAPEHERLGDGRAGYEVRLAPGVVEQIGKLVQGAREAHGPNVETGGPLWGGWDDVRRIIWIDAAGPPPPDSELRANRFVCGVDGLAEEAQIRSMESYGATGFAGTWHTHPSGPPSPSARDHASMADVCTRMEPVPRRFLMLIVGSPHTSPVLRPYVFRRDEYLSLKIEEPT